MSKLDKNQRVRTGRPRNVFDLSHDYLFTATTGQLRPVTHDLVQAGDKVKGKFNFFLRSMPLSTAAMVDVDFIVDYFFVPLELLWLPFGAWWSQTKSYPFNTQGQMTSSLPGLTQLPRVSIESLTNLAIYGTTSDAGEPVSTAYQSLRLLDDLGFQGSAFRSNSILASYQGEGQGFVYPRVFPWQILAYNAIYQHYYRNDEREPFNADMYNIQVAGGQGFNMVAEQLQMKYVNRMDDYFTSTKLSPLVSSMNNSVNPLGNFESLQSLNSFSLLPNYESNSGQSSSPVNLVNIGPSSGDNPDTETSRAVNQLRSLFAQEKLLHMVNMTDKNYDAQVLARLGYDVPRDVKHGVMHLGHDTTQLNIQEIVSGSNTFNGESGSALGDLAGQGKAISRNFRGFDFVAPCHGVVMTVWTCRTRPKYNAGALRKDMISDITHFFTPELDELGMAPEYLYETTLVNADISTGSQLDTYKQGNTIVGWQYRYEYLKRNINRSSLAFMRAQDNRYVGSEGLSLTRGFNSFSQWSSTRVPLDNAYSSSSPRPVHETDYYSRPHSNLYKVRPNELNNIMLVDWLYSPATPAEGEDVENWLAYPWLMYQRDPFIVDGRFDCKKVSAMSLYSMPKLV